MLPLLIRRPLEGANGRNWPGVAVVDPSAPQPAAVAAQELWEAAYKLDPVHLLRVRLSDSARRDMEIMGHEAEVQAAVLIYGDEEGPRRQREAEAMRRGYDGLFARVTTAGLIAAMQAKSGEVRRWVERNRARLQDLK